MSTVFSGAAVRARMKDEGVRAEELAVLTGKSFGQLGRILRGDSIPSATTIELLADALHCQPGDFFTDDGKTRALPPPRGEAPVPPMRPETRERLRQLLDLRGAGSHA